MLAIWLNGFFIKVICTFKSCLKIYNIAPTFKELMKCNTTKIYLEELLRQAKEETNYCQKKMSVYLFR